MLVVALTALAAACSSAGAKPTADHVAAPFSTAPAAPPAAPHGGVHLNVLVVTDGTPSSRPSASS